MVQRYEFQRLDVYFFHEKLKEMFALCTIFEKPNEIHIKYSWKINLLKSVGSTFKDQYQKQLTSCM